MVVAALVEVVVVGSGGSRSSSHHHAHTIRWTTESGVELKASSGSSIGRLQTDKAATRTKELRGLPGVSDTPAHVPRQCSVTRLVERRRIDQLWHSLRRLVSTSIRRIKELNDNPAASILSCIQCWSSFSHRSTERNESRHSRPALDRVDR